MSIQSSNIPPEYLKGFNQGYQLAKEIPGFTVQDIKNMPKSIQEKPRIQGIMAGMRQFHHEHYINKVKTRAPKPEQNIKPSKGINRN